MVTTRSRDHREDNTPKQNFQARQHRTSIDLNGQIASLEDHMKRISKDLETIQKQNADLISWLPLRRDREHEERRKEKRVKDDRQSFARDHEETVEGNSRHERNMETPNVHDEVKDLKLKYAEMAQQMAQGREN